MNGFERHGITRLSPSTLNHFAAEPAHWVMQRLLHFRAPTSAAAARGTAVEWGVHQGLVRSDLPVADCVAAAEAAFDREMVLNPDNRRRAERSNIPGYVAHALSGTACVRRADPAAQSRVRNPGETSVLRVRKPKSGEHGCRTPEQSLAVMRSMATRWSDEDIAASLNRMGMPTGQGKTWTAHRVSSLRRVHGIHAYRSAEKNGEWLTMTEAATTLGVTHHRIRRLIKDGILAAEQVVPGAPYQIRASDLQHERVTAAIGRTGRPCRVAPENQLPMFSDT